MREREVVSWVIPGFLTGYRLDEYVEMEKERMGEVIECGRHSVSFI